MAIYVVTRGGSSNTHNSTGIIGTVDAVGSVAARAAAEEKFGLYNGQFISVKLQSQSSRADVDHAYDADDNHNAADLHFEEESEYFSKLAAENNSFAY